MLSVGRDRSGWFEPAVQGYAERLKHYTRLELTELAVPAGKRSAEASRAAEAKRLLAQCRPGERVLALDERGERLDTPGFARLLSEAQVHSQDLLFVVGGDDGLDATVRAAASRVLSLSSLTLPHRLARLVLVEQLYRGFTLLKGEPYHR
ncbi:MAG: 23S rRNA (pseudouridine(1915)-N(3))-methyltransferase RlmH [Myxococcaceae bacterium]